MTEAQKQTVREAQLELTIMALERMANDIAALDNKQIADEVRRSICIGLRAHATDLRELPPF